jgi:hypothetical protein
MTTTLVDYLVALHLAAARDAWAAASNPPRKPPVEFDWSASPNVAKLGSALLRRTGADARTISTVDPDGFEQRSQ